MDEKQIAFILVVAGAFALFGYNLRKFVRIAALGKPANLSETWGMRVASLMKFFFGQRKVMEEKRSWHHLAIYWGFLVVSIATTDMLRGDVERQAPSPIDRDHFARGLSWRMSLGSLEADGQHFWMC